MYACFHDTILRIIRREMCLIMTMKWPRAIKLKCNVSFFLFSSSCLRDLLGCDRINSMKRTSLR